MTDLEMWSGLVSFLLPLTIALVQQPRFTNPVRVAITTVSCLVASAITTAIQGDLTLHRWSHSLLVMGVGTLAFYRNFWKPASVAPRIEHATSPGGTAHRRPSPYPDRGLSNIGIVLIVVIFLLAFGFGLAVSKLFFWLLLLILIAVLL